MQSTTDALEIVPGFWEARWYAAYTRANHEKKVRDHLERTSVPSLLPLYETTRRWKDRRKRLHLPLFPGYVFVRIALADRLSVLRVPGVAHLVGFNGLPCALPEEDIEAIQSFLNGGYEVKPHPYLRAGRRARVKSGPFQGLVGIILRTKNRTRFVLSLELIMRSIAVELEGTELEPIELPTVQYASR